MYVESWMNWEEVYFPLLVEQDCLTEAEQTIRLAGLNHSDPAHVGLFLVGVSELFEIVIGYADSNQDPETGLVGEYNRCIQRLQAVISRTLNFIDLVPEFKDEAIAGERLFFSTRFEPRLIHLTTLESMVRSARIEYLTGLTHRNLEDEKVRQLRIMQNFDSVEASYMLFRAYCVLQGALYAYLNAVSGSELSQVQKYLMQLSYRRVIWDYDFFLPTRFYKGDPDPMELMVANSCNPKSLRELLDINVPSDLTNIGGA